MPPGRPSVIERVLGFVIRSPTLDRPKAEFYGFAQGDGLVAPLEGQKRLTDQRPDTFRQAGASQTETLQ